MVQRLKACAATALLAIGSLACAGSEQALGARNEEQIAPRNTEKKVADAPRVNQRFRTLDEYLAYLERAQAPIDGAWYRQIRPGVYELQRGNARRLVIEGEAPPPPDKLIFTRQELLEKYGFTK